MAQPKYASYSHKFNEILEHIEHKGLKKAEKACRDFEKQKFAKDCPPYAMAARMALCRAKGNVEETIRLLRELNKIPFDDFQLRYSMSYNSKAVYEYGVTLECYKKLAPIEPKFIPELISIYIIIKDFKNAQLEAQKYVKAHSKASVVYLINAICFYLRFLEKPEKTMAAIGYAMLQKCAQKTAETIQLSVEFLLAQGQAKGALDLLLSPENESLFDAFPILYTRLMVQVYTELGQKKEAGDAAAAALHTPAFADSLIEWQTVVENLEPAEVEKLANEILTQYPQYRGPRIALIHLAQKTQKDIIPLLLEYAQKYHDRPHLLGDLRPFLSNEVCAKLAPKISEIQNFGSHEFKAFVTGEAPFPGTALTGPRDGSILAQDVLRHLIFSQNQENFDTYLKNSDNVAKILAAIDAMKPFEKEPDTRVALIRLYGLVGLTAAQRNAWESQRLEAINYLNLADLFIGDCVRFWDVLALKQRLEDARSFVDMGEPAMSYEIKVAMEKGYPKKVKDIIQFRDELIGHTVFFLSRIAYAFFLSLQDPSSISEIRLEWTKTGAEIDALNEITDTSALPIVFRDENLPNVLYPSCKRTVKGFAFAFRLAILLKLGKTEEIEATKKELAEFSDWAILLDMVAGKEVKLDSVEVGVLQMMTIALVAKITAKMDTVGPMGIAKIEEVKKKQIEFIMGLKGEVVEAEKENQIKRIEENFAFIAEFFK